MKYIMCSRNFPKGHPRQGEATYFVEKIWKSIWDSHKGSNNPLHPYWELYDDAFPIQYDVMENIHQHQPKPHTIRNGSRFKPGDMASLRVWSDKPYRSKQIEFAQVEVKKVWDIEISEFWFINGCIMEHDQVVELAKNDGLAYDDFVSWFNIHPKKKDVFRGQVICWNDRIIY